MPPKSGIEGKRQCVTYNRVVRSLNIAAAAWVLLTGDATFSRQGLPPEHKSIHQIELEAHRYVITPPARAVRRAQSLSPSVPPNRTRTIFGFYPYWAPENSELRFYDITHLAVFSVEAAGSGQLVNLHGWPNTPLIQAAHDANVRVVLVCTLFSASQLDALLSSPGAQQVLISNLKEQVLGGGADGINIDFEGVPGQKRANLVLFMKQLAIEMRAAVPGAHISLDTPAVDWSDAFDYAALADICDALMIMGYDYYWSGSTYAGPVAPLAGSSLWGSYSVQTTIANYLIEVGPERSGKLLLGVPYYGYDWPVASDTLHARALGTATARIYGAAASQAALYGRRWEDLASVPWYSYFTTNLRQTWFEDRASLTLKYDLVFHYGLQGIGIWALTYDRGTSDLWELIEQRFAPVATPDPPEITAPSTFFDTAGLPISLRAQGNMPAVSFEVAVGTTPGGTEICNFLSVGLRQQILLQGFRLDPGVTYYVTARSRGEQDIAGDAGPSVPITLDVSRPVERKYLPHWASGAGLYTGLALLNTTAVPEAFLIRGYVTGQADPIVTSWVLKPGQQMADLVSEETVLGSASVGKEGWLEISCENQGLRTMYAIGDTQIARSLDGGPLLGLSDRQILSHVDDGRARVDIVNPNAGVANLELQLFTTSGRYDLALSLPAKSLYTARVADMFAVAFPEPARFTATGAQFILVKSDLPVACSAALARNQDTAVVPGLPLSSAQRRSAFSHVVWGEGYETEAVLLNPSDESTAVELQLSGSGAYDPVRLILPPWAGLNLKLGEAFGRPGNALVRGWLSISVTAGSGILGSVWLRSADYTIMAALPLETPDTSFLFPHLAQGQGFWTGLSIANAETAPNHVWVEALDADGRTLGAFEADLAPGEQSVALLYQYIPATVRVAAGRVEVRSTGPLLATEIFGSDTLSFLMAVPGNDPYRGGRSGAAARLRRALEPGQNDESQNASFKPN